jgi:hypothetical protein
MTRQTHLGVPFGCLLLLLLCGERPACTHAAKEGASLRTGCSGRGHNSRPCLHAAAACDLAVTPVGPLCSPAMSGQFVRPPGTGVQCQRATTTAATGRVSASAGPQGVGVACLACHRNLALP